jgi:4-azaleucine resistance transporter AzlC
MIQMPSQREASLREFRSGLRAPLPLVIGVFSFGLAYGILAIQAGLSFLESTLMSLTVFAGAAQFVATGMLMSGAGALPILVTTFMINSRHFLMSASLAPHVRGWKLGWKALLSFLLADETYAITMFHFSKNAPDKYYQLGVGLNMYAVWLLSSIAGSALGPLVANPQAWGLDFALPATFIALILPMLHDWRDALVCITAGLLSIVCFTWLPGKWYVTFASLAAIAFGWGLVELCKRRSLR